MGFFGVGKSPKDLPKQLIKLEGINNQDIYIYIFTCTLRNFAVVAWHIRVFVKCKCIHYSGIGAQSSPTIVKTIIISHQVRGQVITLEASSLQSCVVRNRCCLHTAPGHTVDRMDFI